MTMTATQFNRNCQNFINLIEKTDQYERLKQLLGEWKQKNKPAVGAIQTFMNLAKLLQDDEDLVQQFNKCLVKEATIPKKPTTNSQVKQLAMQNQKSSHLLDTVLNWIKADQKENALVIPQPIILPVSTTIQELSEQQFSARVQNHRFSKEISKILLLYRRCIISLKEFKSLIEPIYLSEPSAFNMLFQYCEQLQIARRKLTIFAPLTDLVDQKYPVQQVGNSYILIPDGYSNYSLTWQTNQSQKYLNRICCSVPLGSEGSFVIARKNQFEEQLFKNEEEKYEIDQTICTIKGAISKIQKDKNLNSPLFQKLLTKIYPYQNVFNIMISQPQIAKQIILPRLYQKIEQLYKCKEKFNKACEDVSAKNFTKSLDYRCFYFKKNDKRFNSTQRWDKQIELRKQQIINKIQELQDEVNDRQALQRTRCHAMNTFDNITKQQMFQDKKIALDVYNKKEDGFYPAYPSNQTFFIMSFQNQQVFNDVLQIILYHCQKKPILQLIVLKLFKKFISRRLVKDVSIIAYVESKYNNNINNNAQQSENNQNSNANNINYNLPNANSNKEPLNEPRKDRKHFKDITEHFNDIIQEQIQPLPLEQFQNPFEGPNEHTFISTKTIYYFVRYLLTIYQRFLKAKQYSDERKAAMGPLRKDQNGQSQPSFYTQFLAIMIFKSKDPKQNFEEHLRKIASQEAFIYFTLDKFIVNMTKLINNINTDSLTHKILKDETKDYQNQLKKWSEYTFSSITNQLTRVYRENQTLFRFTYSSTYLLFISMWENSQKTKQKSKKQSEWTEYGIAESVLNYIVKPSINKKKFFKESKIQKKGQSNPQSKSKQINQLNQSSYLAVNQQAQYLNLTEGVMQMKGEHTALKVKRKETVPSKDNSKELERIKKFIKRI